MRSYVRSSYSPPRSCGSVTGKNLNSVQSCVCARQGKRVSTAGSVKIRGKGERGVANLRIARVDEGQDLVVEELEVTLSRYK